MKKYLFLAIAILLPLVVILSMAYKKAIDRWEVAMANIKSYDKELSATKEANIAYQLTLGQLNSYQDSILQELNETRKELKIKNSKIQSLQYVGSSFVVSDTVLVNDTIFKEPEFSMDTVLGDDWYSIKLGLKYPSQISVNPSFRSEKHVFISTKRETVNPPKKFFVARWFQRKHSVLQVDVVEKNPHVTEESSKYIKVVR